MFGKWMTTIAMMTTALSLAACTASTTGGDVLNGEDEPKDGDRKVCAAALSACAPGTQLVDTNGDGCEDTCEPVPCPAVMFDCAIGTGPADSNGDGCLDTCKPVVPPACPAVMMDCAIGTGPADSDGDGCIDTCAPVVPPQE